VNSIKVKGTVESVNKSNVFTSLGFRVKEVAVHIGDYVEEGQVLCVLDTEDLEMSIEQLKAELDISQKSSLNQYENNQRIYDEANGDMSNNRNAQVVAAENSMKSAWVNLQNAQRVYNDLYQDYVNNSDYQVEASMQSMENARRNYEDAVKDLNDNTDPNVTAAENAAANAKLDLDTKELTYSNNKILYDNGIISEQEYNQSFNLYSDAKNRYDSAQTNFDNAKTSQSRTLEQLKNALDMAESNYNNAVTSQKRSLEQAKNTLDAAQTAYSSALDSYNSASSAARQGVDTYKSNLNNSAIALNKDSMLINIQRLEKQLSDSVIKSPKAGTVTAVYAKEGSVVTGLLFVIEDTEHLKISSSVKEYDYSKVQAGMEVIIKSDSTGDTEYYGVISRIDPAAVKNTLGETLSINDVEFGITIDITSENTPLKIGMNTNLSLVLEKKSDIYCVRYDAVVENEKGENVVFIAENSGSGVYRLRQIAVEIGISNDFYREISSEKLKEGAKVMNDVSMIISELKRLDIPYDKVDGLRFRLI